MKIFMIECTEDELRANRGIMDAVVDVCRGLMNSVYGTCTSCCAENNEVEPQKSEDKE